MGFTRVYDYTAGKLDWLAAGLATEGSNAQHPRAGDVARGDVPTCGLDERLGEVAQRARAAGWDACVVVNAERVVLGLLRAKELAADPDLRIEQAMRPGPSTFRPYVSIKEMAQYMADRDLESSPITTSDGRLVGGGGPPPTTEPGGRSGSVGPAPRASAPSAGGRLGL